MGTTDQIEQFDLEYQLRQFTEQFDELPTEQTNVFSILGIHTRERRLTRFLRWVLDPDASHEAGRVFLDAFLDQCGLRMSDEVTVEALVPIDTDGEDDDAEIDLVLIGDETVLGVEIKTTHQGKSDKLEKEEKALSTEYPGYDHYELVYLTYSGKGRPDSDHRQIFWATLISRINTNIASIPQKFEQKLVNNFTNTIQANVMTEFNEASKETELYLDYYDAIDDVRDAYSNDKDQAFDALEAAFFSVSDCDEDDWEVGGARSDYYIKFYKDHWKGVGEGVNLEFEPHVNLKEEKITLRLDIEHKNKDEVRESFESELSDDERTALQSKGWEFTNGSYAYLQKSVPFDVRENPQESIEDAAEELHELRDIVEPHLDTVAAEYSTST